MQLRERNSSVRAKLLKSAFGGVIIEKLHKRSFSAKILHSITFLMTQPILSNSNSIDAARQVQHDAKLKRLINFNLGEQFSQKFSQREFPSQIQTVLITFEWMEIDEKCQ
jgi:hypothetical protein